MFLANVNKVSVSSSYYFCVIKEVLRGLLNVLIILSIFTYLQLFIHLDTKLAKQKVFFQYNNVYGTNNYGNIIDACRKVWR